MPVFSHTIECDKVELPSEFFVQRCLGIDCSESTACVLMETTSKIWIYSVEICRGQSSSITHRKRLATRSAQISLVTWRNIHSDNCICFEWVDWTRQQFS